MKTFYRVNSMTFRIARDDWDKTSTPKLTKEYNSFIDWLNSIEPYLNDEDKEAAKDAANEWKSYLDDREISRIKRRTRYEER